jgi:protein-S-isoprenylcysteine O-methyltransferase Ste14
MTYILIVNHQNIGTIISIMTLVILPELSAVSLTLCILLITYTTYLCGSPPNPTPYNSAVPDSLRAAVTPRALFIRRSINVILGSYHAFLCLTYPALPPLTCPRTSNLVARLFTWTPHTIFCLIIVLLGSSTRLYAFSTLGKDFTFRLAKPQKLVTSGLYNYMQHPSYTGRLLIAIGNAFLIHNPNGPIGCWLPARIVDAKLFWRILALLVTLGAARITRRRIKDEEKMLKDTFGKEWENWHARTKRFLPGIY